MIKKDTQRTKASTIKREITPRKNDIIKTEEVKSNHFLPSECDIVDIPIKQEEPITEVKHYGTALDQSLTGVYDTINSRPISLGQPSIDNNIVEELSKNTAELPRRFSCQHCALTFKYETLYNIHVNEMHKLESNNLQFHLKRRKPKPNHNIVPDPNDPNFYCTSCDAKYLTKAKFKDHIRGVHKTVDLPWKKSKPNHSIVPDPDDPNFYCKSCDSKYASVVTFRSHIRKVHNKTVNLPLKRKPNSKPNQNIKPDPDDPNFYCASCDTKYSTKTKFRDHIRGVHKTVDLPPWKKTTPDLSIVPDPDDPSFYCKSCDTQYINIYTFRSHLRRLHKAVHIRLRKTLHPKPDRNIEPPDPNDPNFYCKSCARSYSTRGVYRNHLRSVHKMTLEPLIKKLSKPNYSIEPDPEDPNFYCKSCATYHVTRGIYRYHIRKVHKMTLQPLMRKATIPNHRILPDPDDPDFYCKSCTTKYTSRNRFRDHIRLVHKITLQPLVVNKTPIPNYHIMPDLNDPHFYCKSCDTKYVTRAFFQIHLRDIHKIILEPLTIIQEQQEALNHSSEPPDPNDPNFYCKPCAKKYRSRGVFRSHLVKTHKMTLEPIIEKLSRKPNDSIDEPDPADPNFHCKSCDSKYLRLSLYRSHLRNVHKMTLKPLRKKIMKPNYSIIPDPDDPNFYCRSCTNKYPNRGMYRDHMRRTHKMILQPLTKRRRVNTQP